MKEIGENLAWTIMAPLMIACLTLGLVKGCDILSNQKLKAEIARFENGYEQVTVPITYETIWVKSKTDTTLILKP